VDPLSEAGPGDVTPVTAVTTCALSCGDGSDGTTDESLSSMGGELSGSVVGAMIGTCSRRGIRARHRGSRFTRPSPNHNMPIKDI
jgi:hypothetical protein